jgi:hypothetical protein
MREHLLIVVLTATIVTPSGFAQKRLGPSTAAYVPSGFGGRAITEMDVELALDVAGGRDKCYLHVPPDPTNWNHLWTVKPVGDAVMFVSRVDGMALDAAGGKGNPYPRVADPSNINLLWILSKVGDDYMIWSKVTNVVLDANGGRGRPYLSSNPDPRNVNQLWSLRKVGEYVMIVSKVRRRIEATGTLFLPAGKFGQSMPVLGPDGNPLRPDDFRGKTVLLTFWSMHQPEKQTRFDRLRGLRSEFLASDRLRIISICVDGGWDEWFAYLNRQTPLDKRQPFSSDSRWWQYYLTSGDQPRNVIVVPNSMLFGPDCKVLADHLPDDKIRDAVEAALKPAATR